MVFNSLDFLLFFPTVSILYFLIPPAWRWFFLLAASSVFYMMFIPKYILILFFLIITDYILGIIIEKAPKSRKKLFLVLSIITNLGTLFIFKYFNFFNEIISGLTQIWHLNYPVNVLYIILPLGLSFHVFQSLSYVMEVYRGKYQAERHLGIYALYVMFFPQLVAGPIERPQHLLPQLHKTHSFNSDRVVAGLELMLWGFFKKLVIADVAAIGVNHVYANLSSANSLTLIIAAVLFSYQLYCDFSGYSDIALGSAKVLGYDLMENFNRPYAAQSITAFWQRWHISLSSWLKDYLYYPLVLSRKGASRLWIYSSTLITFLLIGLWHGANMTYVIMGGMYGAYLVFSNITKKAREKVVLFLHLNFFPRFLRSVRILFTFALVTTSWIFFRAPSLDMAWLYITRLGFGFTNFFDSISMASLGLTYTKLATCVVAIVFLEVIQYLKSNGWYEKFKLSPVWFRLGFYYLLIFSILIFGNLGSQPFIYFQF